MSYSAVSFTAGETPTAAKWNLLGSNDASFNDASGTPAVPKLVNRQDIAANSTVDDQLLQFGWTYVTGDGSNLREAVTVTFPTAYDSAPVVFPVSLGYRTGSNPTAVGDFSSIASSLGDLGWLVTVYSITTTNCIIEINKSATALAASTRLGIGWLSIGTKSR